MRKVAGTRTFNEFEGMCGRGAHVMCGRNTILDISFELGTSDCQWRVGWGAIASQHASVANRQRFVNRTKGPTKVAMQWMWHRCIQANCCMRRIKMHDEAHHDALAVDTRRSIRKSSRPLHWHPCVAKLMKCVSLQLQCHCCCSNIVCKNTVCQCCVPEFAGENSHHQAAASTSGSTGRCWQWGFTGGRNSNRSRTGTQAGTAA